MKNFNNTGIHHFFKVQGVTQKQYIGGNSLKRWFGQFAGVLAKKRDEGVFEEGVGGRVDTAMHTMT